MHPLTIEDILSQETREKIETYEQLGYYFVAFRALDETYFRYSEEASSTSSSTSSASKTSSREQSQQQQQQQPAGDADSDQTKTDKCSDIEDAGKGGKLSPEIEEKSLKSTDASSQPPQDIKRKRGIVEIVEGHKEGVEGAGVGAVNMYLVVFGDGIISVSRSCTLSSKYG
jgi:Mg2+ and Co2+ transporter CorA